MNKKICLMFSGQGSQKTGMGKSLFNHSKKAKQIFECASDVLNCNMLDLCTNEANSAKLLQTGFAQPAIVAVSLAAFQALIQNEIEFSAVVGHSLGSVSAIAAAKVVSAENCFKIVKARAKAMQLCENENGGAMCAIINSNPAEVNAACKSANGYVVCANFNGAKQIVISGERTAVCEAAASLKEKNCRCVELKVKAAFHSKLMEKAVQPFEQALRSIEFKTPEVDIYSNVTGKKIDANENIKKLLVEQIVSPVLFTTNLLELEKAGFDTFIELGPGKPLCAMVKSTLNNAKIFNVCDEKSLSETLKSLQT